MKEQIILNTGGLNFLMGDVENVNTDNESIDSNTQKKSFLYNVFSQPENGRILISGYLFTLMNSEKYEDRIIYAEKDNLIDLSIEIEKGLDVVAATIKVSEFEKLKNQVGKDKQFATLEEGIMRNLLALFHIDNEHNNRQSLDIFIQMVLGVKGIEGETEENKKNIIEYMLPFFIEKTEVKAI